MVSGDMLGDSLNVQRGPMSLLILSLELVVLYQTCATSLPSHCQDSISILLLKPTIV